MVRGGDLKPEEVTRLNRSGTASKALVSIAVLILLILPLITGNQVFYQFMILILWYAYLTTSWNLVGGFAGVLPLGHAAFAGIGAYISSDIISS